MASSSRSRCSRDRPKAYYLVPQWYMAERLKPVPKSSMCSAWQQRLEDVPPHMCNQMLKHAGGACGMRPAELLSVGVRLQHTS